MIVLRVVAEILIATVIWERALNWLRARRKRTDEGAGT